MVLLLRKLNLYFTKDTEAVHYFPEGSNFFQGRGGGFQMLISIGDWLMQSKKDGKDQESIQSSTAPDPGYQWESNKLTVRHHKQEPRGQDNLQIYYSGASATVLSKGTEPR